MRITGGVLTGRKIEVPPGIIRPAMDRMRESVFAVLGNIEGKSFLDLFTGSGIIALEAASRKARPLEAVEMDGGKRRVLLDNVKLSAERIHCHFMPVELYVKRMGAKGKRFDYIFCDPPFPYKYKGELLANIARSTLMDESSLLMLHHPSSEFFDAGVLALTPQDRREYGRSVVDFFSLQSGRLYGHAD
ncbi:MAG: RsmD family RNA methyltransferase [Spirochaetaceae bacterium]|jgi:16S rRNA (guanine(966)-N(2))-methyltransferase RsmD|nr:RsmD family RNA methyltransferase [Spirochaetaceae bacterium]